MQHLSAAQAAVVAEQRLIGRTDRQIEKLVGLTHGFLARPWVAEVVDPKAAEKRQAEIEVWREKQDRFWRAVTRADNHMRGWRPNGDCISSRPNAAPLRAAPHRPSTKGAI